MARRALVLIGSITAALGVAAPAVAQIDTTVPTTTTTAEATTTTTAEATTTTTAEATTTSSTTEATTTSSTTEATTTTSTTEASTTTSSMTSTTVAAESSALSITVPSGVDAGAQSGASGTSFSAALGSVQVDDSRPGVLRTWTATVSSSSFTGPGGTIGADSISYWSGPATAVDGTIVAAPGQLTSGGAVSLDATRTAFSSTGGTDTTSVRWSPTIIVTVPAGVEAGDYSGTITHSVA